MDNLGKKSILLDQNIFCDPLIRTVSSRRFYLGVTAYVSLRNKKIIFDLSSIPPIIWGSGKPENTYRTVKGSTSAAMLPDIVSGETPFTPEPIGWGRDCQNRVVVNAYAVKNETNYIINNNNNYNYSRSSFVKNMTEDVTIIMPICLHLKHVFYCFHFIMIQYSIQ